MRRIAAALLCSLFLVTAAAAICAAPPVCAGTLSGDEQSESFGQTTVTAQVESEDEPAESTDTPSGGGQGIPDTGKTGDTPVDRLIQSVRTGDYNTQITLLFLLLMGSSVLVADRIREQRWGA